MESVLSHKILPDTMKDNVSYVDTNLEQKKKDSDENKEFPPSFSINFTAVACVPMSSKDERLWTNSVLGKEFMVEGKLVKYMSVSLPQGAS